MSPADRIGEATVRRFLDRQRVLSLAVGGFAPIFDAYDEHVRRWVLPADGLARSLLHDGLAALALHLATRPQGETVGFTINIPNPAINFFLTGDAGERSITGRAFTEDVQPAATSRLFVESFRPQTGVSMSSMDVHGRDVYRMFEEYYARSEQLPARYFALGDDRHGLVQALPDGGRERVEAMTAVDAAELFEGPLDPLEEKVIRFRCGCNLGKIVRAMREMFAGRDDELFRGEAGVEAFCPRCGARWWVERTAYESAGEP